MKNSNDIIGNRTHNLPACSRVPQPTAPPDTPYIQIRNVTVQACSGRFHGKDTKQIWHHSQFNTAQISVFVAIIIANCLHSGTINHFYSAALISDNRQMLHIQQVYRRKYSVIVIIFVHEVQQITAGSIF
jgi:hypothetical protein